MPIVPVDSRAPGSAAAAAAFGAGHAAHPCDPKVNPIDNDAFGKSAGI